MSKASNTPNNETKNQRRVWLWPTMCSLLTVAVAGLSLAFYFDEEYEAKVIDKKLSEYPLIDPVRNFVPQEHFVVNIQPLRDKVNALAREFGSEKVSIYIEFLNTGANISVNPNNYIFPASFAKLPLAMIAMRKVEKGEWTLDSELILMVDDIDSESGSSEYPLYKYPIGTRFTVEELLKQLLVYSDNTAYQILIRNLKEEEFRELLDDTGLQALVSTDGKMSAKEYSRLFRALYVSSFLKRGNSQKILQWLDESTFDDFLSSEVPKEIPFPHKYAERVDLNIYSDSGVVYVEDRPYLITVMIQGDKEFPAAIEREKAINLMKEVSREAYDYFSTFQRD